MHVGINRTYRDDSTESGLSPFQEFLAAESGGSLGAVKGAAEETSLFSSCRPASTTLRGFGSERDSFFFSQHVEMRTKDFRRSTDT